MFGPYDMSALAIRQTWLATHGRSIQWVIRVALAIRVLPGSPPTPDIRLTVRHGGDGPMLSKKAKMT